jgi:hypothetical protein
MMAAIMATRAAALLPNRFPIASRKRMKMRIAAQAEAHQSD